MQQHGRKYLSTETPTNIEDGVQNKLFSEHGHVVYQIKGNHKCRNMVANILPIDPPDPGAGVKFNFFRTLVMLHN